MPRAPRSNLCRKTRNARVLQRRRENVRESNNSSLEELQNIQQSINSYTIDNPSNRPLRNRRVNLKFRSAFEYNAMIDYACIKDVQIGSMNQICSHCSAKKWKDEAPGLCCSGGKVKLTNNEIPPEPLKSLILGNHPSSKHFLDNARKYNTLFQMTSFGTKEINVDNFMPTFKIQGQVYHKIGSLLPELGNDNKFLQIYFVSEADQISLRKKMIPNLNEDLILTLQQCLLENNNLIKDFKYNLENRPLNTNDNFKLIIHADRVPANEHRGRYNAPTNNEVAVLLVDEDKGPRDIVLHCRDGRLQRVSELHRSYDPLQYPLMYSKGEDGYYLTIPLTNSGRNKTVSCMQFYAFRLMIRVDSYNFLHYFKNLFNQYCTDMMAKMISERLSFIRNNQKKLRADEYIHLRDSVQQDSHINANDIGQTVILPSSFTGSPRYMNEKCQDSMTYVRKYGRPDLFITFTCNPEWTEIKNELFTGQKPSDRHDLISRVFHLKMKNLLDLVYKKEIFGKVNCYALSVEWQKRGLPHCHLLVWLQSKIQPDEIDLIISAEIPDKSVDPLLYDIVCKNMCHGPRGDMNNSSPCMKNGQCSKKYPRKFVSSTQTGDEGYPTYRRRSPEDGGRTAILNSRGKTIEIDNRWIVPYCPMLLRCFNAHINVEFCNSVQAIRYICKYITKGSDRATFTIENERDEINKYVNGRYICTSEATWRFFEFPIHLRHPTIIHLAVHLENQQRIYFNEENLQQVLNNPKKTTLLGFFELCQTDDFVKTLLYADVPSYYVWNNNKFIRRKRGSDVEGFPGIKKDSALGRVYTVHPNQSECFYLRLLLHNVKGPTSFDYLKTVDGNLYPTFQAACAALGLLENDNHWKDTLSDASLSQSSSKLRELFSIILIFCHPSNPIELWNMFQKDMCQDILHEFRRQTDNLEASFSNEIFNKGLIKIEDIVVSLSEKKLSDFNLPTPTRKNHEFFDAFDNMLRNYDINKIIEFVNVNLPKLVPDQLYAFKSIIESVNKNCGKVFFLDAPGGTGKTFLINILFAKVRSSNNIAIGVASSGIAATLINGGRTAHSTFKLPLNVTCGQEYVASIKKKVLSVKFCKMLN